jgi:2-polyprenyl-3-methyl-5-hydroxy-6-metoxy-1,4-benzoquinol methylase
VRALEIGCGSGKHAILAAQAGARVVAIDVSPEAIRMAQVNALAAGVSNCINFMVGDVELLEDNLGKFDLVIDHEVFSSLDLSRFLPVCSRVLKSGGTLLGIECLGHNPIFNLNRTVKSWIGRRTKWAAKHVMTVAGLAQIESMAVRRSMRSFHLVEMLGWPISRALPRQYARYIRPQLIAADSFLFKWLALRKFAFKIVFEFVV